MREKYSSKDLICIFGDLKYLAKMMRFKEKGIHYYMKI